MTAGPSSKDGHHNSVHRLRLIRPSWRRHFRALPFWLLAFLSSHAKYPGGVHATSTWCTGLGGQLRLQHSDRGPNPDHTDFDRWKAVSEVTLFPVVPSLWVLVFRCIVVPKYTIGLCILSTSAS